MGDYNASFWGPEQNKVKKLKKKSTPNIAMYFIWLRVAGYPVMYTYYIL